MDMQNTPFNQPGFFIRAMPLSNWLAGYDRYSCRFEKRQPRASFPGALHLAKTDDEPSLGRALQKAQELAERLGG